MAVRFPRRRRWWTSSKLVDSSKNLYRSISHTTRNLRTGEQWRRLLFVSTDDFDKMIVDDDFIEYASVFGAKYGTKRKQYRTSCSLGRMLL